MNKKLLVILSLGILALSQTANAWGGWRGGWGWGGPGWGWGGYPYGYGYWGSPEAAGIYAAGDIVGSAIGGAIAGHEAAKMSPDYWRGKNINEQIRYLKREIDRARRAGDMNRVADLERQLADLNAQL